MFFIEMGQGIIGLPPLVVGTTTLYTCTLIAGRSAGGYAGAYHYPSSAIPNGNAAVIADMEVWASILRPNQIILCCAANVTGMGGPYETDAADRFELTQWATRVAGAPPTMRPATGAGMEALPNGVFDANRTSQLQSDFDPDHRIDLRQRQAGRYLDFGGFTLIGENREN